MKLTWLQAAWHRIRRSGLTTPYESAEAAAQALVGVQAQLLSAAGLALWNRTPGLDHADVERLIFDAKSLLRLWGQRNTLHLYPTSDWPLLHAAQQDRLGWFERGYLKRGGDPERFEKAVQQAAQRLLDTPSLCRDDVRDLEIELEELSQEYWAGLFMSLERRGLACRADLGSRQETRFAHRRKWVPNLTWNPPPLKQAKSELARRYFRAYGPASAADFGYWWGASLTQARRLTEQLGRLLVEVEVEGEKLLALSDDLPELTASPPPPHRWPVRLLHRFDPLLLGHKDKSWLISEQHYKRVWRSAGQIEAVMFAKGGIGGTWRCNRRNHVLEIVAQPWAELGKSVLASLQKQARGVARFFNLGLGEFQVRPFRGPGA